MSINKKKSSKKQAQKNRKPIKRDMARLDVYYDVSIKVSDKSLAERIQRSIRQRCGFNAEIITQAR